MQLPNLIQLLLKQNDTHLVVDDRCVVQLLQLLSGGVDTGHTQGGNGGIRSSVPVASMGAGA